MALEQLADRILFSRQLHRRVAVVVVITQHRQTLEIQADQAVVDLRLVVQPADQAHRDRVTPAVLV